MKIIMDTEKHTVTEIHDEQDKEMDATALETIVSNLLITALVGTAVKYFKMPNTRALFIEYICDKALKSAENAEIEHENTDIE